MVFQDFPFSQLFVDAIMKMEKEVIKSNVENQLYKKGIRSDGSKLPPYAESTKVYKRRKGQRIDHMTLRDTEDFHKNWLIRFFDDDEFDLVSDSGKKSFDLISRYGILIFGITKAEIKRLRPIFNKIYTRLIVEEIERRKNNLA